MNQSFKYNSILLQPKSVAGWLALSLGLTLALYFYLINVTFMAVSNRRAVEEKLTIAQSSLTKLSSSYLSIQAGVTKERAKLLGFVEAPTRAEIITIDHIPNATLSYQK